MSRRLRSAHVIPFLSLSLPRRLPRRSGRDGIDFIAVGDAPSDTSIDFFDLASGKRKILTKIGKKWHFGLTLSPDRRWLLFPTVDRQGRDLMVVDGVR